MSILFPRMSGSVVTTWLLLSLFSICCGCGNEHKPDPGDLTVAVLGDQDLTLSEFKAYLEANLPEIDDQTAEAAADNDRVRSRMFDNFIDEEFLLAEAARRGITVGRRELELHVAREPGEDRNSPVSTARLETARRGLLVQKLIQNTLSGKAEPTDEDIDRHLEELLGRDEGERRLVLRSLLFESAGIADRVYREIRRRRLSFEEAVVAYEQSAGQGEAVTLNLSSLPPEVQEAIGELRAGTVSRPIEIQGQTYIFLVVAWLEGAGEPDDDMREMARADLMSERTKTVSQALLSDIKSRTVLRIRAENLPFTYVPPEQE